VVRGNGENLIDFMYVDDAVDAMLRLLRAGGASATIDLASGAPITVNGIVAAMARVLDVRISVRHEGVTEEYIQFRSVDPTMRERFGFNPTVPFDDGLRRLAAFYDSERHAASRKA
jgi:nucleoside-diphosphate-sugar epimerase